MVIPSHQTYGHQGPERKVSQDPRVAGSLLSQKWAFEALPEQLIQRGPTSWDALWPHLPYPDPVLGPRGHPGKE